MLFRQKRPRQETMQRYSRDRKCRIETSLPKIGSIFKCFSSSQVALRNLNHLLTHILDVCAISFGTRNAVYDPALSIRPFSQIPLHRLRLDLLYPKSSFSHCPSRGRGKSQGTVPGSPLLRVFKQKSEEVARSFSPFYESNRWGSH